MAFPPQRDLVVFVGSWNSLRGRDTRTMSDRSQGFTPSQSHPPFYNGSRDSSVVSGFPGINVVASPDGATFAFGPSTPSIGDARAWQAPNTSTQGAQMPFVLFCAMEWRTWCRLRRVIRVPIRLCRAPRAHAEHGRCRPVGLRHARTRTRAIRATVRCHATEWICAVSTWPSVTFKLP